MDEKEILWKQYEKEVDVYQFYLELLLKTSVFVLGIAGAVVSFVQIESGNGIDEWGLFIPIIMTGGFSLILWFSIKPAENMVRQHWKTAKMVSDRAGFDFKPLPYIVRFLSILLGIVCAGLIMLLVIKRF